MSPIDFQALIKDWLNYREVRRVRLFSMFIESKEEKFKNELGIALENYLTTLREGDAIHDRGVILNLYQKEKSVIELRAKEEIEEMIRLTIRALKVSDNRPEIFDILLQSVYDLNNKISALSDRNKTIPESYFLAKIILELIDGK